MKNLLKNMKFVLLIMLIFAIVPLSYARDLKASLGLVPVLAETPEKGLLVDFVKALDELYTDGSISIDVYPTIRSLDNISKGTHDFMMPMLQTDAMNMDEVPFRFFESLWTASFVLYTNKNKPGLTPDTVADYKVETDRNVSQFFTVPLLPSASIESSLKKVDMGRIDGYIFAMVETDTVLKKLGLKNVKRQMYRQFGAPVAVQKGQRGDEVEKILAPLIQQLRENGTYQKILAPVLNKPFVEW